jgi:hydroxymethylglutaryl-CoA lyase
MMSPDQKVKLVECPRDAWQGLTKTISTGTKVRYLQALIAAGFRHIDAVSFVSPKAVPQMADSEAVLRELAPPNDVEIIGIVVNEKGAERATATAAVRTLGYPCSISSNFLRRNQNQSFDENLAVMERIRDRAERNRLGVVVYISMAFGNPYDDPWSPELVAKAVARLASLGIGSISLADTVGVAKPDSIKEVVSAALHEHQSCDIGVHLHSTRTEATGKVLAAFDAGCRRFDSAMGGLGGCPFAQDELVGNIPTEEVVRALESRGVTVSFASALQEVAALNEKIGEQAEAS